MFRRVSWFLGGAATGLGASVWVKRRAKALASRFTPGNVSKRAGSATKAAGERVVGAVKSGRQAMKDREAALLSHDDPAQEPANGGGRSDGRG